jgi:Flp pilus assembly protein TadD
VSRGQLLRPYPQFTGVTVDADPKGFSNYNSMQLKVTKRFSHSLLSAIYVISKSLGDSEERAAWNDTGQYGYMDNYRPQLDYSLAAFDAPQRLVLQYNLDLPFGHGQTYLANSGKLDRLVSGWEMTGIYTAQSGIPIGFTTATNNTNSYGGGSRPNVVPGCKLPEAVSSLEAALEKRPGDPDLLYYLERASGLLSKQVSDTLVSAHPDSARTHQAQADSDAILRRVPEAEKEFQEVLRLRPDLPGVQLALGELYASASQWPKAETAFRAETQLRPGDPEAAYNLGMALLQLGKVHQARLELVRADSLKKEMPETLYALGKASLLDRDEALAENAWSTLISIESQGELAAQAHFGLAGLYRRQGKVADAAREMELFAKLKATSQ